MRRHVSRNVFLTLLFLPFTAVTGAIASSSRGALLGIAATGVWMFLRGRYRVRGIIPLAALAVVVAAPVMGALLLRLHDLRRFRPRPVGSGFAERAALRDTRAALRRQIREVAGTRS